MVSVMKGAKGLSAQTVMNRTSKGVERNVFRKPPEPLSLSQLNGMYQFVILSTSFVWYLRLKSFRNNVLFTESGSFRYIRTICTSSTCAPFQQSLFS